MMDLSDHLCHSGAMPTTTPGAVADFDAVIARISLDRSSPVPLYYQLAQELERAITEGVLPPGSRLDNEMLIADRLNLSRPTVRQAMQHLVEHGLVVRKRGIGTRVVQHKVHRPLGLTSLFEDLRDSGEAPTTEVLTNEVVTADAVLAEQLQLPEGSDLIHLVRLRKAAGRPIALLTNYLPSGRFDVSTPAVEGGGLYELIRSAGTVLHSASQSIGARIATAAEAKLLDEVRPAALLTMERTAYDDHGDVIEYGRHIYVASRYSFRAQLLSG